MFFFFSSRRRHTRYWRDWSSDVCSSDLDTVVPTVLHVHVANAPFGVPLGIHAHAVAVVEELHALELEQARVTHHHAVAVVHRAPGCGRWALAEHLSAVVARARVTAHPDGDVRVGLKLGRGRVA